MKGKIIAAKDALYKIKALGEMLFELGGNKLDLSDDTLTSIGTMLEDLAGEALENLESQETAQADQEGGAA